MWVIVRQLSNKNPVFQGENREPASNQNIRGRNNRNYNQNSNTQSRRDSLQLAPAFVSAAAVWLRL